MVNYSVKIGQMCLKNPVMTASGTFGYGSEFADFIDLNRLGGFIIKGTTLNHREGNPYPRMVETPSGMLNAVGLQNKGIDYFIEHIYPEIKDYDTNIVVNVSGASVDDYVKVCEKLNDLERIPAIELNISCPNVKQGGMAFGTTCSGAASVVKACRKAYTITGGLSGACIRPIAVRMVWQVANAVKIPVIGLGGIMNGRDAIEFILAGATAVQLGTANFIDPSITVKVVDYIADYMKRHGINDVNDLIGAMER